MTTEKQEFLEALSALKNRKESTDKKQYSPLIEETEALIKKYNTDTLIKDIGNEALAELYFLAAELLFGYDLANRAAAHSKTLENESKTLEYLNKVIELNDIEEYSYELWNFLSTAGHVSDGIAALERFIERTGGTAKVLSRAAEYILMYADSEDTETIQKSLDYFYRAIKIEPDRYNTYWAYFTDLEEAVDVCPQLFKEAVLCLDKLIELSFSETSPNHDMLGIHYYDLTVIYNKMKEYGKAVEAVKKGLATGKNPDYGVKLMITTLNNRIEALSQTNEDNNALAYAYFDLAHCYHITNQPESAAKYYLAVDNANNIIPQEYRAEFLIYYRQNNSFIGKIKKLFSSIISAIRGRT